MAQTHRGGKNGVVLVLASSHQSPGQFHFVLNKVATLKEPMSPPYGASVSTLAV
jgi:hypothetical protein